MIALMLAAGLALQAQEDAAVLYREGLYEEIDQGNLEKAMELYGRVLKGGGDGAVKARALFRRGACLEKAGKKPDAEQAYRDVQERFADQAEIVKLARGRLAALSANGRGQAFSPEAEVQQLILDLGTNDLTVRDKALQRLTLIGAAAIPDLKRALGHKDRVLAAGAARVLVTLEPMEGLYEALAHSPFPNDLSSMGPLLEARPEDREKFYRDAEKMSSGYINVAVSGKEAFTKDDRLVRVIEDRIVAEHGKTGDGILTSIWRSIADPGRYPGLVRRLLKEESGQRPRLKALLSQYSGANKESDRPELSKMLREGLKDLEGPDQMWVSSLLSYMTPEDLFQGLCLSWLRSDQPQRRFGIAFALQLGDFNLRKLKEEYVELIFDALAAEDVPLDAKADLARDSGQIEKFAEGPRKAKLLKYYLEVLRKTDLRVVELTSSGSSYPRALSGPRVYVIKNLADDAPDWELIFHQEFRMYIPGMATTQELETRLKSSDRLKSRFVEACKRAMGDETVMVQQRGVLQLDLYATPSERRGLAKLLPSAREEMISPMVRSLARGFSPLTADEATVEAQEIAPLFKSPNAAIRRAMTAEFRTSVSPPAFTGIMKEALSDADAYVRYSALQYWSFRRTPEAVALLIDALKDPEDRNKLIAVQALGNSPTLDAVPALLPFLRSPNNDLRSTTQAALKAIQQYFEEQEQWRTWYEDMKKKVPKEK